MFRRAAGVPRIARILRDMEKGFPQIGGSFRRYHPGDESGIGPLSPRPAISCGGRAPSLPPSPVLSPFGSATQFPLGGLDSFFQLFVGAANVTDLVELFLDPDSHSIGEFRTAGA